jgi:UDP-glucose 4-epimerase
LEGLARILGSKPTFYEADCNDASAFTRIFEQEKTIGGVIHFAAHKAVGESVQLPLKYYRNNIGSLLSLLDAAGKSGISNLVFSSSCTVYGEPEGLPVDESFPILPAQSPYGNTKQVCEEILRDAVASDLNFKVLSLRYFNPIGAHPSADIGELPIGVPGNLVPFVVQTAAGWRQQLSVFGDDYQTADGTCIRDYIHILDLAQAHILALSSPQSDFYNLGTGGGTSVREVIETCKQVTGRDIKAIEKPRRAGDPPRLIAASEKIRTALGWQPQYQNIRAIVESAWAWHVKNPNGYGD